MIYMTSITIQCDQCQNVLTLTYKAPSAASAKPTDARFTAALRGWKRRRDRVQRKTLDLCPTCGGNNAQ